MMKTARIEFEASELVTLMYACEAVIEQCNQVRGEEIACVHDRLQQAWVNLRSKSDGE